MARIYISSTYSDLKDAREQVYRVLRKMGHNATAMEDYVATDKRPLDKCPADVASCDIYVGVFAWRYGYIPPNQDHSITELEFREAVRRGKPCLLFLLREEAPWPRQLMDRDDSRIEALRAELAQNYMVGFFRTSDELVTAVSVAVAQASKESQKAGGPDLTELLPTSPAQTHIVDAMHRGDYTTITEAIEAAAPGDKIHVRPGLYEETLKVTKPLEIIGQGNVEEIVVQGKGIATVGFATSAGRISNLTVRHTDAEQLSFAVAISEGRLELEGCDISNWGGQVCVVIVEGASPLLRRNRIHDGTQHGVYLVDAHGAVTLEDNDIFANGDTGVAILGGSPTLRNNRIRKNASTGVNVSGSSRGTLEDNDIFANGEVGVMISREGADPTLRNNRIHKNGELGGIVVKDNGRGTLEDNDIFANVPGGVLIVEGADPTLRNNRIHDQGDGLAISGAQGQGKGMLVDNDIFANSNCGVKIIDGGNPTLRRNHIHNNLEMGVFISEGLGTLEENDISSNGREGEWQTGGVMIISGVSSTLDNNRIHDNAGYGVFVSENPRGELVNNDIFANGRGGVLITAGDDIRLQYNRIHDHTADGIRFSGTESKGMLEGNEIFANGRAGVVITEGGDPTLQGNRIYDNAVTGVQVSKNSRGTLEGNDISANGQYGVIISEGSAPMLRNNRIYLHSSFAVTVIDQSGGTIYDNDLSRNGGAWSVSWNSKSNLKRGRNKEHPGL